MMFLYTDLVKHFSQLTKYTNKMQGAANKMLLVDGGSMKDLISQQINMKRETARLMQLRRKHNEQRHDGPRVKNVQL